MSAGRTIWWPKDAGWWRREAIVELGEEFGPAGPAVLDWLSCEAKSQNDGGWVKAGVRSCARGCFVAVEVVREVLSRSVTLGSLHELALEEGRFTCRISGWAEDNDRGRAAVRKATQRDRQAESGDVVTPSHGESRSVTPSSIEERTEGDEANASSSANEKLTAKQRSENTEYHRLAKLLDSLIVANGGDPATDAQIANWRNDVRLMVEQDGRTLEQIKRAVEWAQASEFWRSNILSMGKLREKYATLRLQAQRERPAAPDPSKDKWGKDVIGRQLADGGGICRGHPGGSCETVLTGYQAASQIGLCDPCFAGFEEQTEGAA